MSVEYTLSIIKPDGVRRNLIGKVNSYFEEAGLEIAAQKMIWLTKSQAENFYEIHRARPFFDSLVNQMVGAPVVVQVLKGLDAVAKNRKIMGSTNPKEADKGTIRADLSEDIEANTVHGSDSVETATQEIKFFFSEIEILR
jgi:nucleoside-diphosphate kinase